MTTAEHESRIAELKDELRQRDEKITDLRTELAEARDLVDRMREHLEDSDASIDNWISVFDMAQDEAGLWQFDRSQAAIWEKHAELLDTHNKLVREWNKLVPRFNATVAPKDLGRPLGASDAQRADVLKRHKAGQSLRVIVKATSLSMRTVRTIVEKSQGTDRTAKRAAEIRRKEFDRQRAAAFRARKSRREDIPKEATALRKNAAKLVKSAKGLGSTR